MKTVPLHVQLGYLANIVEIYGNSYYEAYTDCEEPIEERRRKLLNPEIFALLDFGEPFAIDVDGRMLQCVVSVNDIEKMYHYIDMTHL